MFRLFFRLTFLLALLVPLGAVALWVLAFDRVPEVGAAAAIAPEHIDRAQRILRANDPRRVRSGAERTVMLRADDVDVAVNYLAHRYLEGAASAAFEARLVIFSVSARVSMLPTSPWANLHLHVRQGSPMPTIERVSIGRLPVPLTIVNWVASSTIRAAMPAEDRQIVTSALREATIDAQGARLRYEWSNALVETVRGALISSDDRERLRAYQEALADASPGWPAGPVSMARLWPPVFRRVVDRTKPSGADAVAENRAAILVLTFYVDGRRLSDVVPEAREWRSAASRTVVLGGRNDFAKHFIISAVLSANTGGPFADAVGIFKEVSDSRGGSGFSFNDLAADRAGSKLGTWAETDDHAQALQTMLAAGPREAEFMPSVRDLPEFLPEAEFVRRYGGVGGSEYNRMVADIDRRIAALALYK